MEHRNERIQLRVRRPRWSEAKPNPKPNPNWSQETSFGLKEDISGIPVAVLESRSRGKARRKDEGPETCLTDSSSIPTMCMV